jgi:endonuclease/exonuclease/phosphatase family metal-dependent hydrolase
MPKLRIMTFNIENLLVRFDFKGSDQGLASLLDVDSEMDRANLIRTHWNVINDENRVFTALSIKEGSPDVICLQEVDNFHALKSFHDKYISRICGVTYPHKALIEGNDPRGIDVAVLSRHRIDFMATHQDFGETTDGLNGKQKDRVFKRDCLEVRIIKDWKVLPIFICHFKSMSPSREETRSAREAEARAVKKILQSRFGDPSKHDWLVVGDLNDYTETDGITDVAHSLHPLLDNGFSEDLVKRISDPKDRWTQYHPSDRSYQQLDYVLASPSLAAKNANAVPTIIRQGLPYRAERYSGARWPRVGYDRPKASDHCPVVVELEY